MNQSYKRDVWCFMKCDDERERAYSRSDGYGYSSPPSEAQQPSPASYEQRTVSQDSRFAKVSALLCEVLE